MQGRLILIDGSSYVYRAFYALPPLKTVTGEPSGATYGVIAMLKRLQQELPKEDNIVVVLDSPTPTFRHQLYAQYKANRLKMPEELKAQIPGIKAIISAMGFPLIVHPGVEADDIIATLACSAEAKGIPVVISTNDKDFAQLVTPKVHLMNTMTGGVLDVDGVVEKFGVKPEQIVDYLSLVGDTSDNVPGIPLVGPKTALKWLKQYDTLAHLLVHADKITGKVGQNLRDYRDQALLAKQLITIKKDVPLEESLENLLAYSRQVDVVSLTHWFEKLEFRQWLRALQEKPVLSHYDYTKHTLIVDESVLDEWIAAITQADYLVLDLETTSLNTLDAEIVGIGLGVKQDQVAYIPLGHNYLDAPLQLTLEKVLKKLTPALENPLLKKIGHNLKYDQGILSNYGITLKGLYADTMLEAYLLDSTNRRNDLDTLALEYLGHTTITFEAIAGKGAKAIAFNQIMIEKAAPYTAEDISVCLALHHQLEPKLNKTKSIVIRDTIEIPLVPVLSRIERKGVCINVDLLNQHSQELEIRLKTLEEKTYAIAGQSFNLGSPQQLQAILYDKHHLPILAKTTTGQPSTSEKVLQALAVDHPLPQLILEYRTLSKLKSTYTDALPKQVHPKTGRVHTAYHQAVVATGRLSSSNPNLQNIPIRTLEGRRIRSAFEVPEGYKLLSADYSQIELRIMAHFSEDAGLLEALYQGEDVHAATAAGLFGTTVDKVTAEQRRRAKAVNFGLMYGMSAFGLARQLQIKPEIAQEIITQYFERYPGVKKYMDSTRELAHTQGYVSTLSGRRLALPSITSNNRLHQKAAERAAINAPLQGTAADIIKCAMIEIDHNLRAQAIDASMIMQVHDELVFEVKEEFLMSAKDCIESGMQNAMTLKVPLLVTTGIGDNWGIAH